MENLRVDSGIKQVCVNDNGEYIEIPISDTTFIEKFFGVVDKFETIGKEISLKETDGMTEREKLSLTIEKSKEIVAAIDDLFGEECCRKVFGKIVPMPDLFVDFLEQISPIIGKHAEERTKKLTSKYNKNRKGSTKQKSKEELIADYKAKKESKE